MQFTGPVGHFSASGSTRSGTGTDRPVPRNIAESEKRRFWLQFCTESLRFWRDRPWTLTRIACDFFPIFIRAFSNHPVRIHAKDIYIMYVYSVSSVQYRRGYPRLEVGVQGAGVGPGTREPGERIPEAGASAGTGDRDGGEAREGAAGDL